MNEKVSVIIPVYNGEKYIIQCLKSITVQTYKNIEIIVIDDGSIDNTYCLVNDYVQTDHRVICVHKENKGVSAARNFAIRMASGEYVCFVDADDIIDDNMIEDNIQIMLNENQDLVINDYYIHKGKVKNYCETFADEVSVNISKVKQTIICTDSLNSPWICLYKLSIIQENDIRFPENIKSGEDHIFNMKYIDYISSASYSRKAYYHYIIHNGSGCRKLHVNQLGMYDAQLKERMHYSKKWKIDSYDEKMQIVSLIVTHLASFILFAQKNNKYRCFSKWMEKLYNTDAYEFFTEIKDVDVDLIPKAYRPIMHLMKNKNIIMIFVYTKILSCMLKMR